MGKLTFGGTGGLSYQCDKVEVNVEGAPKCPRCQQRVFFNEEKKGAGKTWHIRCFKCAKCNKALDSTNYNQNNDEILCKSCYGKSCGPHLYGFVAGANLPTSIDIEREEAATSQSVNGASSFHRLSSSSAAATGARGASVSLDDRDHPECCPNCARRVYFAEEVKALKRKWHRLCFKCQSCGKMLEPGKCSEHEKKVYCQPCYGKQFGPRGYGYAGGSGTLFQTPEETYFSSMPSFNGTSRTTGRSSVSSYPYNGTNGTSRSSVDTYPYNGTSGANGISPSSVSSYPYNGTNGTSLYSMDTYPYNGTSGTNGTSPSTLSSYQYNGTSHASVGSYPYNNYPRSPQKMEYYEAETYDQTEPIRGTQEWTESVFYTGPAGHRA